MLQHKKIHRYIFSYIEVFSNKKNVLCFRTFSSDEVQDKEVIKEYEEGLIR